MKISDLIRTAALAPLHGLKIRGSAYQIGKVVVSEDKPPKVSITFKKDVLKGSLQKQAPVIATNVRAFVAKYAATKALVGECLIANLHQQNSWSDDGYLIAKSDSNDLAAIVIAAIKKAVPVTGGGVPGSSYRGSGQVKREAPGEYSYHDSSFGIGD
jgi:hypothetical protein